MKNRVPRHPVGPATAVPVPVILAGGRGTRLAPLTTVLPKPLMPLGDGPILDVLLGQLRSQGWTQATLAVGHMAGLIRAYCGHGERYGMQLTYLEETSPLGTVGPLAFASPSPAGAPYLVMNGDLLTSLQFMDLVRAHRSSDSIATIAVFRRDIKMEFGVVDLGDAAGMARQVLDYREKPEVPACVSMGIYVFEPAVRHYIEPGRPMDLPDLIRALLDDGQTVCGYPFEGYWLDIGRHSDYQQALDDFEAGRHRLLPAPDAAA